MNEALGVAKSERTAGGLGHRSGHYPRWSRPPEQSPARRILRLPGEAQRRHHRPTCSHIFCRNELM